MTPTAKKPAPKVDAHDVEADDKDKRRKTFGQTLYSMRIQAQWSQEYLARQLGVSQPSVAAWEKAINVPDPDTVFKLERVLGLRPGTLSTHLGFIPSDSAEARGKKLPTWTDMIFAERRFNNDEKQMVLRIVNSLLA